MGVAQVAIGAGVKKLDITEWTTDEHRIFDKEYPKLVQLYSTDLETKFVNEYMPGTNQNPPRELLRQIHRSVHPITAFLLEEPVKEAMRLIGQACKSDIEPSSGVFTGMSGVDGYGFTITRPDHLVPDAQGRTFDVALSGLTANNWYGLYHNGAIGAAYNATPLYLRKELGIGWAGMIELKGVLIADEMQLEINSKERPIYNMLMSRVGDGKDDVSSGAGEAVGPVGNIKAFRFPVVEYLKPAKQYRSQFKANTTARTVCPSPIAITYAKFEYMRETAPTAPATTAP